MPDKKDDDLVYERLIADVVPRRPLVTSPYHISFLLIALS